MKPRNHARNSVRRWRGVINDYLPIHNFIDSSKAHVADMRHRALFHHSFGCYIVEQVFGHTIINNDGIAVSTRDVAEQHILDDLGVIPSVSDYLYNMTLQNWMGGKDKRKRKKEVIPL